MIYLGISAKLFLDLEILMGKENTILYRVCNIKNIYQTSLHPILSHPCHTKFQMVQSWYFEENKMPQHATEAQLDLPGAWLS